MKTLERITVIKKRINIIRAIRVNMFDYSPSKQDKAGRLIDKLKVYVIKYSWMTR